MGGWFPQGNCTLSVGTGAPLVSPPMAKISIGRHEFLSGHCIRVTNRVESLAGPAQTITEKLELYAVYQVSAWVQVAPGKNLPARCITIKVLVDDTCFDVCSIEVDDEEWHEIGGSFRIEKQPSVAAVHVGGPTPSVDLMIAGFAIFPVDRQARFERLKKQTEKVCIHIFAKYVLPKKSSHWFLVSVVLSELMSCGYCSSRDLINPIKEK